LFPLPESFAWKKWSRKERKEGETFETTRSLIRSHHYNEFRRKNAERKSRTAIAPNHQTLSRKKKEKEGRLSGPGICSVMDAEKRRRRNAWWIFRQKLEKRGEGKKGKGRSHRLLSACPNLAPHSPRRGGKREDPGALESTKEEREGKAASVSIFLSRI